MMQVNILQEALEAAFRHIMATLHRETLLHVLHDFDMMQEQAQLEAAALRAQLQEMLERHQSEIAEWESRLAHADATLLEGKVS